jgi:site-specific DNA recombinase
VYLLREKIERDGYVVEPELCFVDDGESGSTLARPVLERLRDQAAAGAVDRLYLSAPNRLARRLVHQMLLVEEFQACGVELVFVNRPLGTTPEDQLLLQVQGVVAEYERAQILERTRRGRVHAARCGRVSVMAAAPFGYRYVDKHSGGGVAAYEVIEEEAQVVQQIFAWVAREGCSLNEVCRRLQRLGVRTRHGKTQWNATTIKGMLANPTYRGEAAYGRSRRGARRPRVRPPRGCPEVPKPYSRYPQPASEQIVIAVPALVDANVFAAAQEQLQENRRRLRQSQQGPRYLLQGLLVCAGCGYAFCGRHGSGPNRYYRCQGSEGRRFYGQRLCHNRLQRTADLDAAVWHDVCALLSEPERLRQEFERRLQNPDCANRAESDRLDKAISKVKQGMSRLLDAYTNDLVETKDFRPRMQRLQERRAQLEGELQTLNERAQQDEDLRVAFSHIEEFADQMKAGLSTADWPQQRNILRALVKRIEIDKETIRIVYKVPAHPFAKGPQGDQVRDCSALRERQRWHG